MKKHKWMLGAILFSIILFIIALIIFNDFSFILIGSGIMIIGFVTMIKINESKER